MLKKPYPYHKTPVNHTLEQYDLLKRYYSRAAAKDGEAKKDRSHGDVGGFPAVENVILIFGGPTVDMSNSPRKRERHEVLTAGKAPPSFLDWLEDAITFSREDHPNRIPNPGQYPLVVDPVIGNAHFSKVLMDGGSGLNILYTHTLCLLGIGLDQLLTPKFGTGRSLICGPSLVKKSVRKKEGFSKNIRQRGSLSAVCFQSARKLFALVLRDCVMTWPERKGRMDG
jgi:hypothetical protein